jgi:hypothetical protein
MKKILILILLIVLMNTLVFANEMTPVKVELSGKLIEGEVQPFVIDGRTMVPVRWVTESLNKEVDWLQDSGTVLINTSEDVDIVKTLKKLDKTYADYPIVNLVIDGNIIENDVPPFVIDGTTFVPLRKLAETIGLTVNWDADELKVVLTLEGEPVEILTSKNESVKDFRKNGENANPFNEKIGYIDGDIFDFSEFDLDEDGIPLEDSDFEGQDMFSNNVDSSAIEKINFWPRTATSGKGPNYEFFEGLDILRESFYLPFAEFKMMSGIKIGDYPFYDIDSKEGILGISRVLLFSDETNEQWNMSPNGFPEDKENYTWGHAIAPNKFWHFGLSNYEGTNLYFPRITADFWYDLGEYKTKGCIGGDATYKIESIKLLIQFWSNSDNDAKMIWRTLEYLIRGAVFPDLQTSEYDAILEGVSQGTIIEYPDGTRIKFLDVFGHSTRSLGAEFLFMSMPFEKNSFTEDIGGLRD